MSKPDDTVNDCSNSRFAFNHIISPSSSSSWFKSTSYPAICRTPPTENKRKQYGYFLHITDMHVRHKQKRGFFYFILGALFIYI